MSGWHGYLRCMLYFRCDVLLLKFLCMSVENYLKTWRLFLEYLLYSRDLFLKYLLYLLYYTILLKYGCAWFNFWRKWNQAKMLKWFEKIKSNNLRFGKNWTESKLIVWLNVCYLQIEPNWIKIIILNQFVLFLSFCEFNFCFVLLNVIAGYSKIFTTFKIVCKYKSLLTLNISLFSIV